MTHHLDPQRALALFDPSSVEGASSDDFADNTQEMVDFLKVSGRGIDTFRAPLSHQPAQIEDLVAFLEALTDPCVLERACLEPWLVDPVSDDVDGQLLIAIDAEGKPL